MSISREFRFINGSSKKALLVLEPKSSEFWVDKGATIRIVANGGGATDSLDVEHFSNGLVVYMAEDSQVTVYQDGRLLSQDKVSKKMGWRLTRE